MESNDRNHVLLSGEVQWIGARELRQGSGPRQQYGIACRRMVKHGSGEAREELVWVPVLVHGEPIEVRSGDRIQVQGRLAWHVDERNGLKMGFHVVVAEEVTVLSRSQAEPRSETGPAVSGRAGGNADETRLGPRPMGRGVGGHRR